MTVEIDYDTWMNGDGGQALYRVYAEDDELLYIGISNDPPQRFWHHENRSPWWHEAARVTLSVFDTRNDVEAAEKAAIRAEAPRYNIEHNVNRPPVRPEQMQRMRAAMNKMAALLGFEDCDGAA